MPKRIMGPFVFAITLLGIVVCLNTPGLSTPRAFAQENTAPESATELQPESYVGIGLIFDDDPEILKGTEYEGCQMVVMMLPEGPAAKAGVHEGWILTAIDGVKTEDMTADDVIRVIRSGASGKVMKLTFIDGRITEPDNKIEFFKKGDFLVPRALITKREWLDYQKKLFSPSKDQEDI